MILERMIEMLVISDILKSNYPLNDDELFELNEKHDKLRDEYIKKHIG